jgi:hypothetical protein
MSEEIGTSPETPRQEMTDEELAAALAPWKSPALVKRMISDLLAEGRITHEQASFATYLRPEVKNA